MDSIIIFCAKYLVAAVVLIWLVAWFKASRQIKLELAAATAIAVVIAALLDKLLSKLYYDPRPFVSHHLKPLISHAADNGFPSEHTLFSVVLALVLVFYSPKLAYWAFAAALIIGAARVAAHVHSPIDIIGAIAIAAIAACCGYWLTTKLLNLKSRAKLAS